MKTHFIRLIFLLVLLALSCKGPEGPQGPSGPPGTGGIGDLTDPRIMPVVLDTYPPANSQGPYFGLESYYYYPMQVRFNKIMDRVAFRTAVTVISASTAARVDTNSINTFGGDVYIFAVVEGDDYYREYHRWKVAEIYTLRIGTQVRDINGNSLSSPYTMTFVPEPRFRVKSADPANGSIDVYQNKAARIVLNSKVNSSFFSHIQWVPTVAGIWEIDSYDSSRVIFFPSRWSFNTSYTLYIDPYATDAFGHSLGTAFTSTFRTMDFRVSSIYPEDGATEVDLSSGIRIYFSGDLDTGTVRSSFRVVPPVSGYLSMGGQQISIYPDSDLTSETTYSIRVDTTIRATTGARLAAPFISTFRTAQFRVTFTQPVDGEQNVYRNLGYIYVGFSARLDTTSIRSALSSPNLNGTISTYEGARHFYLNLTNRPLLPNTTYTVTISTAIRSMRGSHSRTPYTFSFTTGQ